MNKFIKISVSNSEGSVLYSNDMTGPQQVMAALELFSQSGNVITISVCELSTPAAPASKK